MPTAEGYIGDMNEVFDLVKGGFRFMEDEEQHGQVEDWRIPEDFERVTGDCDDFAIACRTLLKHKGHRPRLLFCNVETGQGHLICVLGKVALDNRRKFPLEIETLVKRHGYELISISGTEPGDGWHAVKGLKE